jgi:hypothetical protein
MNRRTKKMAEHVMTPELRKKMLTRLPFSRNASIDYTPAPYLVKDMDDAGKETDEYAIPEEFRPVFKVRPLSTEEKTKLGKFTSKNMDETALRELIRTNITGIEKLFDAGTMEEIPFKGDNNGGMDKALFESLPVMVIRDLFVFISGISGLSTDERAGL